MQKNIDKIEKRAEAMREKLREMFQRRAEALQDDMENLVERTKNFIENSELNESVKDRWNNWVDDKKQSFDDNMENENYVAALADYTALRTKIADLTLRFRERLVSAYKNLIQQETRLQSAVEQLRTLRARLSGSV
jgi:hypothetical protein